MFLKCNNPHYGGYQVLFPLHDPGWVGGRGHIEHVLTFISDNFGSVYAP